jgi:hypothetical protein
MSDYRYNENRNELEDEDVVQISDNVFGAVVFDPIELNPLSLSCVSRLISAGIRFKGL